MMKWFVDKESKIPLYLQLKALIKHYISTGIIVDKQRLPTVKVMAKDLGLNFETIRKAYKDLEKEGLLCTARGKGTFANGFMRIKNDLPSPMYTRVTVVSELRSAITKLMNTGMSFEEIQTLFTETLQDSEEGRELVIFTECNQLQIREISQILKDDLKVNVHPVLLTDLRTTVEDLLSKRLSLRVVVTTGFHINEVKDKLADLPVKSDFVVTNMSPTTRRLLDAYDKKARYGLIGRDLVQLLFFKDLVKSEMSIESEILSCSIYDEPKVKEILESVDVLLLSPPVYEQIKAIAPASLPVFNVFDRVDPLSLRTLKERLFTS